MIWGVRYTSQRLSHRYSVLTGDREAPITTTTKRGRPAGSANDDSTVHRRHLAADVSASTGLRFELVDEVLVAFLKAAGAALVARRRVSLRNFGVFEPRDRGATTKRKPDDGSLIPVPPSPAVGFRPSPVLKRWMKGEAPGDDETPD